MSIEIHTEEMDAIIDHLLRERPSKRKHKLSPTTSKEDLFEWAERFVRRFEEDFEELAKR